MINILVLGAATRLKVGRRARESDWSFLTTGVTIMILSWLTEFTKETGVQILALYFDSNEAMYESEAKKTTYDMLSQ